MKQSVGAKAGTWLRGVTGLGITGCAAVLLGLAAIGALAGWVFPKYEANALLDTPGANLAELKRVVPGYASEVALGRFIDATGNAALPAAERLLVQARDRSFWERVANPILPLSRKDTKEIGDMKEGLTTSLIGLELRADARDPVTADAMVLILSDFFTNALLRERIRAWIVAGLGVTRTRQNSLRADIIATQLNIDSAQRRITDLKAIGARYPDASRADGRQVVSVAEGGDRFLPLPAQLVAAESNISQLRESILRSERQVRQFDLLAGYYLRAEAVFKNQPLTVALIPELMKVADQVFARTEPDAEWARESRLRTQASIADFSVVQDSFGIRNGARVGSVASRSPARLAALGVALGAALLGAVAFLRASLNSPTLENPKEEDTDTSASTVTNIKHAA